MTRMVSHLSFTGPRPDLVARIKRQNHGMNRSGGVLVFEVVSRSPPLGYARRYVAARA